MLATCEYADPRFLTFLQAQQLGGSVKRGAEGFPVIKWHFPTDLEIAKNPNARPWARGYTVFGVEQCEGLDKLPALVSVEHDSIAEAQLIIDNWADKPTIEHGGYRASYNPTLDTIHMPEISKFTTPEGYYDTCFHELVHSTGHVSRLNRLLVSPMLTKQDYSQEELCAEIGAAMLCAEAHIDGSDLIENNAAYLQNWLQAVKGDPNMIPKAASVAAKATDLIMGRNCRPEEALDMAPEAEMLVAA